MQAHFWLTLSCYDKKQCFLIVALVIRSLGSSDLTISGPENEKPQIMMEYNTVFAYFIPQLWVSIKEMLEPWMIQGVNFTNVLRTAFMRADPKSAMKLLNLTVFFALLGSAHIKAARW